jgi:hypothetical protein
MNSVPCQEGNNVKHRAMTAIAELRAVSEEGQGYETKVDAMMVGEGE